MIVLISLKSSTKINILAKVIIILSEYQQSDMNYLAACKLKLIQPYFFDYDYKSYIILVFYKTWSII